MFLVLTYGECDSQSSRMCWEVWYPYRDKGFPSREAANAQIVKEGSRGEKYHVVELARPVTLTDPQPELVPA
ncbi:MAG: hypothetical protein V3S25_11105 [Nitrospirales bacterium]